MMFVIAAVFILVISFVIALVSLIKEQSKIEKENVAFGKNDGPPKAEKFQAENQYVPEPDSAVLNVSQPQPQPQPPLSQDFNASPIREKPWWEREIQKRDDMPSNHLVHEDNIANTKQQQEPEVPFAQAPSQELKQEKSGGQTPQDSDQNLYGSFSVSDLADKNQES